MNEIPVTIPWLAEAEVEAVRHAILSGWVTQGPRVKAFEEAFAAFTGAALACAVSSCTTALHLALLAVGVKPGDVVVTVSHSFIATANAIRYCQAEPLFVDIDPTTLNLDPDLLAQSLMKDFIEEGGSLWYRDITRLAVGESPIKGREAPVGRLAAILVVHQVGMPADLARILAIGRKYGLPVVEDAACAIGSEVSLHGRAWEKIGRPHGDVACFSFHPRKVITTGDGGMLTTNNPAYDQTFRLLRQHGMNIPDAVRHGAGEVVFEDYTTFGFNYRLTDVQAAIGIEQLRRLPEIVARRRVLAAFYDEGLKGLNGLKTPSEPPYARTNWQSYIIELEDAALQRPVMQALLRKGIHTRRGIMCAHLEAPYSQAWPPGILPKSEAARDRGIILPLYPTMTEGQVEFVVSALKEIVGQ